MAIALNAYESLTQTINADVDCGLMTQADANDLIKRINNKNFDDEILDAGFSVMSDVEQLDLVKDIARIFGWKG